MPGYLATPEYNAENISVTPAGDLAANNIQGALEELDSDLSGGLASKLPYSYGTATPSTTDSGFLWYDSNSTPPVPKYWNGSSFATLSPAPGLEFVTTESFSAVNSFSINGAFTAAYDYYQVMLSYVTSGTAGNTHFRLRASGSDATGSNYGYQQIIGAATSVSATQESNVNQLTLAGSGQTRHIVNMTFFNPALTTPTEFQITSGYGSERLLIRHNTHSLSTSYDGFSIYNSSANTMTGNIRVYGYRN